MRSGFFNANITGYDTSGLPIFDRAESADFFAMFFHTLISNGVYAYPGTSFQVVESTGMQVEVNPGKAYIEGYFAWEDSKRTLMVQASENLDRIDRVVLRLNLSTRQIDLAVVKGIAATSPVAPELNRPQNDQGGDIYELGLANVLVSKNSSTISQSKITDTRLIASECGVVHGMFNEVDATTIFKQYQKALDEYLAVVNAAIEGTVYGQLLEQIKSKTETITLQANNWQGSEAPYNYEIVTSDITATSNQDITLPANATQEQIEAIQSANIVPGVQSNGRFTLRAFGDKPTINIPITVIKRGEK